MPRKARLLISSGIYHVCLRSVNQQIIFEDEADYRKFLSVLTDCKQKYDVDIYAYCLMSNHIHLLLHAEPDKFNRFFRSFGVRFVQWYYNIKYHRTGHLFQDRFFSIPVSSSTQFLKTIQYIHENPVNAHMCRYPNEYVWSSCASYYGQKNPLVEKSMAIALTGSLEQLQKLFMVPLEEGDLDLSFLTKLNGTVNSSITDESALPIFREITGALSPSDFQHMPRTMRNSYVRELLTHHLTCSQISRFSGISYTTIERIKKSIE